MSETHPSAALRNESMSDSPLGSSRSSVGAAHASARAALRGAWQSRQSAAAAQLAWIRKEPVHCFSSTACCKTRASDSTAPRSPRVLSAPQLACSHRHAAPCSAPGCDAGSIPTSVRSCSTRSARPCDSTAASSQFNSYQRALSNFSASALACAAAASLAASSASSVAVIFFFRPPGLPSPFSSSWGGGGGAGRGGGGGWAAR